jgi:hypothetical protein
MDDRMRPGSQLPEFKDRRVHKVQLGPQVLRVIKDQRVRKALQGLPALKVIKVLPGPPDRKAR